MTEPAGPLRAAIEWRRVLLLAAVMAMGGVLAWKAWERDFMRRTAPTVRDAPPVAPITDVSDWWSRQALFLHRERMDGLFGPGLEPLVDRCGSAMYNGPSPDEIRLIYLDGWHQESFTVGLVPRGLDAVATWHRVQLAAPPPPDSTAEKDGRSSMYDTDNKVTREMDAVAWQRALAVVQAPAFARLPPARPTGVDGFSVAIESCTGGRYHLVDRWSPGNGEGDADFLQAVRIIHQAAGAVHPLPGWLDEHGRKIL
jgi:hypothetical protein